ncbi:hypothetical protein BGX34_003652 [Mortierella sp. NVP85]|nr:hypothetical protein BGX34_003652 [Mortierella sp. NVP85]
MDSTKHVIIIGAGISGLAAAHELSKHPSIQVTILEARDRIGGRLDTHRNLFPGEHGNIPVDFGASWIHGVDPSNPIVSLAEAAHARLEATNSDVIYYRPGQDALDQAESNHYWAVLWDIFDKAKDFARTNRERIPPTMSFKDWLDQFLATRQSKDPLLPNYMSRKELKMIPLLSRFWSDENAIPLDKVSLKYMDAEILPPGDHCIVADGYDKVLDVLAKDMKGVDIRLEHVVERIEYDVLVTLPLGVLKSNSVTFSPALPERKQLAIKRLGFGTMVKAILYFPTCFWPKDKHFINFLPIPSSIPNPKLCRHLNGRQMKALTTYMNDLANYTSFMPIHGVPVLIGYMANDSAEAFEKLTEQEAMQVLVCQLSHYFDVLAKDPSTFGPTHVFMTRWHADPYARGSYTSIPIGAHQSDLAEFEIPVGARSEAISTLGEHHESCKTEACEDELAIQADRFGDSEIVTQNTQVCLSEKQDSFHPQDCFEGVYHVNLATTTTTPHCPSQLDGHMFKHGTDESSHDRFNDRHCNRMHSSRPLIKSILALGSHARTNSVERSVGTVARDQSITTYLDYYTYPHGVLFSGPMINTAVAGIFLGLPCNKSNTSKGDVRVGGQHHSSYALGQQKQQHPRSQQKRHRKRQQQQQNEKEPRQQVSPKMPLSEIDSSRLNISYTGQPNSQPQEPSPSTRKKEETKSSRMIGVDDVARGRIHFAGEHTTPTSFASVHGALLTGRREAAKIIAKSFP